MHEVFTYHFQVKDFIFRYFNGSLAVTAPRPETVPSGGRGASHLAASHEGHRPMDSATQKVWDDLNHMYERSWEFRHPGPDPDKPFWSKRRFGRKDVIEEESPETLRARIISVTRRV